MLYVCYIMKKDGYNCLLRHFLWSPISKENLIVFSVLTENHSVFVQIVLMKVYQVDFNRLKWNSDFFLIFEVLFYEYVLYYVFMTNVNYTHYDENLVSCKNLYSNPLYMYIIRVYKIKYVQTINCPNRRIYM